MARTDAEQLEILEREQAKKLLAEHGVPRGRLLEMIRWYVEKREADARDAKRYRWLRERDLDTIEAGGVFAGKTPDNVVLAGDDLDEAIDHAMTGEQS